MTMNDTITMVATASLSAHVDAIIANFKAAKEAKAKK